VKTEQNQIGEILRRATRDFERNGLSRGVIGKFEREAPDVLLAEGLLVLLEADESAGYRFLAITLARLPGVFQKLCDRWHLNRQQAIAVAKRLHRVDLNFDTRMSTLLPDRDNRFKPFALEGDYAERALEILDEISPGRRIVPIMRHLTEHPDSKIASKAGLLIGKRLQNLSWARRVVTESADPRLRANAIECFWGMNTTAVIDLFHHCLQDEDNRVVGNAIIGLHEAGDPEAREMVIRIATEKDPEFRMTAAWTIGRMGDSSFLSILSPLAKDRHPEVRRAALKSLRGFHQQTIAAKASEPVFKLPAKQVEEAEAEMEMETVPADAAPTRPQRQFWS
jgi:hypothetical protein